MGPSDRIRSKAYNEVETVKIPMHSPQEQG